jgi:hypothetical protein
MRREREWAIRRPRLIQAGVAVGVVLVVFAALAFFGLRWSDGSGAPTTAADPSVLRTLKDVPASALDAVGAGKIDSLPHATKDVPALTADGKPRLLYVGAEYCPYCAAERWAVVVAMDRFGTFSGLGQTTSAHGDVHPDTATLSFHGSSYHSKYLSFTGYEVQSNQVQGTTYAPLDKLSDADQKLFDIYDGSPYLDSKGNIPFMDLGGAYLSQGASYSPGLLAGLSHAQVAAAIADPSTDVSRAVLGMANTITAIMCRQTNDEPSPVCTSSGVKAAGAALGQS